MRLAFVAPLREALLLSEAERRARAYAPARFVGPAEFAEQISRTAQSRSGNAFLFGRQSGRRGDLDHDTARSVAIEGGDAAAASARVLNLSRRKAGLRKFIMLGLHGVGAPT